MAVNAAVTVNNNVSKIRVGNTKWCFGVILFGATDTYVSGGFDVRDQIRKLFGTSTVHAIMFLGTTSDSTGTHTVTTSRVLARYELVPGTNGAAESGLIKLYAVGRDESSAAQPSGTELTTGDSINGLNLAFLAICSGEGTTIDSQMGP